jgi:hypothetical protein
MCITNTATATNYAPFITAGVGLVGVFIGSFIGRINSMAMIKRQEFNKGAAEFRAAFVDYIFKIRHTKNMTEADIGWHGMRQIHTETVEGDHEKAKIRFEPFIDKADLTGFNAAWENYQRWPEHFSDQDDKTDRKQTILTHIDSLLEYAKPK